MSICVSSSNLVSENNFATSNYENFVRNQLAESRLVKIWKFFVFTTNQHPTLMHEILPRE